MKKFLLITDSALDLKNGVSVTWNNLIPYIKRDYKLKVIEPRLFKTIGCPGYEEIPIALCYNQLDKSVFKEADIIHIATEGTIGLEARKICKKYSLSYTTSFHTNFSEYLGNVVHPILTNNYLLWFHKRAKRILVPTKSTKNKLERLGFKEDRLKIWSRGINREIFFINDRIKKNRIPTYICVSRVSKEKNLDKFLGMKLGFKHKKVLIGDGPLLNYYKSMYNDVKFLGSMDHKDIAYELNRANVFVFPSKTDTFGIVILEAIGCGLPVVAYDVEGPKDILTKDVGILVKDGDSFEKACERALSLKIDCTFIDDWTWEKAYDLLIDECCGV